MSQLKGRKWHVQSAVAIRGEGLYEGLDWCALRLRSTWQAPRACLRGEPAVGTPLI